jgi:hypothetical protein
MMMGHVVDESFERTRSCGDQLCGVYVREANVDRYKFAAPLL